MALLYTLPASDYTYRTYHVAKRKNSSLSEQLVAYPSAVVQTVSDFVIHVSSMFYSARVGELVQTLDNLSQRHHTSQKDSGVRVIYVGLFLHALSFAYHLAVNLAQASAGISSIFFCDNWVCNGNHVIPWLYYLLDALHDGVVWSAAAFVAIFGVRLANAFNALCAAIRSYCVDAKMGSPRDMKWHANPAEVPHAPASSAEMFIEQFTELRNCFDTYSSMAGICILMLMLEMYTLLFCVLGSILVRDFGASYLISYVWLVLFTCTSLLIISLLTEVGHYMHRKVMKQPRHAFWT